MVGFDVGAHRRGSEQVFLARGLEWVSVLGCWIFGLLWVYFVVVVGLYYFIIVDILFYCNVYIILLC